MYDQIELVKRLQHASLNYVTPELSLEHQAAGTIIKLDTELRDTKDLLALESTTRARYGKCLKAAHLIVAQIMRDAMSIQPIFDEAFHVGVKGDLANDETR